MVNDLDLTEKMRKRQDYVIIAYISLAIILVMVCYILLSAEGVF